MLVLTRKAGEQLIIADQIRVTVVSVGPGRVKIGIEAPDWVKVDRQEIHDKKQSDYHAANDSLPSMVEIETSVSVGKLQPQSVPSRAIVCANSAKRAKTHPAEPSEGPDQLENRLKRLSRLPRKSR